ncbi:MAG TPA: sialidase family protein [Ktedonobacteraceae bacterium]|nr:sialidase family protein [Ktedonobacteraceae bacterium]
MAPFFVRHRWLTRTIFALTFALLLSLATTIFAFANVALTLLSTDPYTNSTSQHATEVEPDTYSFGSTIVSAFQVGRFNNGGASNVGFATSTDNGTTWTNGFLPGTTTFANPPGTYDRLSDASVAYDAKHNVWLISYLALVGSNPNIAPTSPAVLVSRSTDGGLTWGSTPVQVNSAGGTANQDKNWTVCDDTATSPFYGNCYTEWDDNGNGNLVQMSTSTDGGMTWSARQSTANNATVIGGQPVVQPNGTVVVPIENANETALLAFTSTNGGASWNSTITVTSISHHTDAGNIRSGSLPTAEIDGSGKVYVVWSDCRFERRCKANDLVMTTSTNGTSWSAVTRIPIDAVGSGVDHFIPGLAVDKGTSGSSAHLGLAYYYYPTASCSSSTCQLDVGFISSSNSGSTWSAATQLAGPMTLTWLANTTQGYMVGDYISTSFANGTAHPVFEVATAKSGSTFNEATYSPSSGLTIRGGTRSGKADHAVAIASATVLTPHQAH